MNTNIREATKNDYDVIHQLQRQVHEIHTKARPDHYKMADITLDKTYYNNLIYGDNTKVFLLEENDQPIAYTILTIKKPKERTISISKKVVFMEDFGVDIKYRGKGLGKVLFKKILEFAKGIEADSLELGVWEFNEDAIKFYEAMNLKTKMRRMEIDI